jgi:hypothetical protein
MAKQRCLLPAPHSVMVITVAIVAKTNIKRKKANLLRLLTQGRE